MIAEMSRGAWLLASHPRPPVGQSAHRVIHVHDKLRVRFYAGAGACPIVIVPSLINRAWIVDLEEDRSLVRALTEEGHPVYLVDWGVPGPEDADEDVAYVLDSLLARALRRIRRHARAPVCLLGYCMGGTLAAMCLARHPGLAERLVLLNAPFRFCEGGRFFDLCRDLDVEALIDSDGLVPVELMKPAFSMLDPAGNFTKLVAIEEASRDPRRMLRTMARERWLEENVPMPGAFAREWIRHTYQDDDLLDGAWVIGDSAVDLAALDHPTLVLAAERDFIAPVASVLPVAEVIPGATVEVLPTGHIGAVVGRYLPRLVQRIHSWL
ncbi:MAG TPA: alpha/beta fold hydrolase [Myxococcota bacterium]|nr:alpha/beta fold hydrolase [Myxococcota bacterium]